MYKLTFIRAANGQPIVKKFTAKAVSNYPNVKLINSHTKQLDVSDNWTEPFTRALRNEAKHGSALLKGSLNKQLIEESRKGHTNKNEPTRLIVIDVDDVELDNWKKMDNYTEDMLVLAAEDIISLMPEFLQSCSFCVNASASLGIKPGINLHIFMMLDNTIEPVILKETLSLLNFYAPEVKYQTKLTASGLSLSFPIDRTLADNSRIIYIGNPDFSGGIIDPVPERFGCRQKDQEFVSKRALMSYKRGLKSQQIIRQRITELREEQGLGIKTAHTFNMEGADGYRHRVISNPDQVKLNVVSEDEHYVRFNLGNGDSNAYWVHKRDPRIVHNFKQEPTFLFDRADPEGFKDFCGHYNVRKLDDQEVQICFMDSASNRLCAAPLNVSSQRLAKEPVELSMQNLDHHMRSYGQEIPDPIPSCRYVFDPHDPMGVDLDNKFINKFQPPPLLERPVDIDERFHGCMYEYSPNALRELCPTIHNILSSITGNGEREYMHLVNWLAYIAQYMDKTGIAWLFHGAQGTGKGILQSKVLAKIFTPNYSTLVTQDTLEDKFNGWTENKLLIACDEVMLGNSKGDRQRMNILKNYITERDSPVRHMRNRSKSVRSYTNWMFFTNDRDALSIGDSDRRFVICPRQEVPLIERFPMYQKGSILVQGLEEETPLFATFLQQFEVDKECVHRPLETLAKEEIAEATRSPLDTINNIIKTGNVDPLVDIMHIVPEPDDILMQQAQQTVRIILLHIITQTKRCYKGSLCHRRDTFYQLYVALSGNRMPQMKFLQQLQRMGSHTKSQNGLTYRATQPEREHDLGKFSGIRVDWKTKRKAKEINELQKQYAHEIYVKYKGFPEWLSTLMARGRHIEFRPKDIE